jgi:hypothetical protein
VIEVESLGLKDFERLLRDLPAESTAAARMAVNEGANYARTLGAGEIAKTVRLKPAYITGRGNAAARLSVTKRAKNADLEAVVTGRDRPTSLARFRRGAFAPNQRGQTRRQVRVQVSTSGGPKTIPGAFYIRLRQGSASVTEEAYNEGIAVRLKPGQRIPGKKVMSSLGGGLYTLYGPSVGQVYRSVAADSVPRVGRQMQQRFDYHLSRALRG